MAYDLSAARASFDPATLRPLRFRQWKAISEIRQAVRQGHKRIILQGPTGFGKTLTAAHIIGGALEKGKRPVFVCPALTILEKTISDFEGEGIRDIGVIQAQHERTDFEARVQIASVQTLVRRKLKDVGFFIRDEAHIGCQALDEIIDQQFPATLEIGLSATPWRRGMGLRWTKLIVAATTRELIDEGWLCPYRGYGPGLDPDLSGVRRTAGDYNEGDLSAVMQRPQLVADIVQTWLQRAENRPTFLFGVDRAHAQSLQDSFQKFRVSCGYIDGNSTPEERKETFRRYRNGDDRIIASVGCLTTGVDEDVRCIIMARPTESEMLWVQCIGRGLRTAPGKEFLLILDHAGNAERLGFPDAIHHEHLDTRLPGEKGSINPQNDGVEPVKPTKCQSCGFLMPPNARQCPECGAERPRRFSSVETAAGELVEFGTRAKKAPETAKQRIAAMVPRRVYQELLSACKNPGEAAHRYRDIFGRWPKHPLADPKPATDAVINWVKHERLRWIHSRKRRVA